MENIKINTSQNVGLKYSLAGVGQRLLAIILDDLFKYAYAIILYTIWYYAKKKGEYSGEYEQDESDNQVLIGIFILLMLPFFLYHFLCETFLNGQSFGKKIIKLKVVKLDGTRPNFGSYLIRWMFRIIDDSIIGLIVIAASKNAQRIGDMVAGTTVIELNKKLSLKDTILHKESVGYEIVYSQVAMLSDTDANTIKEVLDFSIRQQKPEHIKLLSEKIRNKYGISDIKQTDQDFLKTLLMDYSHYQFEK